MGRDEVARVLEANRGGAVRLLFADGEESVSQVLFVDDHIYYAFCHRLIATNRPEKHAGAYQPDSSWIVPLDRVTHVEPADRGPRPWGYSPDSPA